MARPNTIFESAHKGDFDMVKNRLEEDPSLLTKLDENSRMLIHWCSVGGNLKLTTHLIELGSPIDPTDDTDTTPLILASSAGHAEIVNLLLEKGANVNHQSSEGHSALQYAASKGRLEICKSLLHYKANVNISDKRGATPLHRAASKGNLEVVRLLIANETINVNARDIYGCTPLHLACEEDRQDVAKLLVQSGGDLEIKNKDGATPLDQCTMHLKKALEVIKSKLRNDLFHDITGNRDFQQHCPLINDSMYSCNQKIWTSVSFEMSKLNVLKPS